MATAQADSLVSTPSLTNLISSYGILPTLASWISAVDLYHLALTNRTNYSYILGSPNIFKALQRQSLCDGRGLAARQAFRSPYYSDMNAGNSRNPHLLGDEEIEVYLYNVKCDEADALPCAKCQINICEECRYYPRAAPGSAYPDRRPHLNGAYELQNIMCLCPTCDAGVENEVAGNFLNELCDCDLYTRWICTRCVLEESKFTRDYFVQCTRLECDREDDQDENGYATARTKTLTDHQFDRSLWCMCGSRLDDDTRPRCTWCKRRHLPESEWVRERREIGDKLPFFDNNPDYPRWISDRNGKYPDPYPKLGRSPS